MTFVTGKNFTLTTAKTATHKKTTSFLFLMDREQRSSLHHAPVLLRVGKNGITDAFIKELQLLTRKKPFVKVRFLPSFADTHNTKEVATTLAMNAHLSLLKQTGNIAVFAKK